MSRAWLEGEDTLKKTVDGKVDSVKSVEYLYFMLFSSEFSIFHLGLSLCYTSHGYVSLSQMVATSAL